MDWGGEIRGRESTVHLWHVAGICGYHRAGDLGILHDFIRWHMDVVHFLRSFWNQRSTFYPFLPCVSTYLSKICKRKSIKVKGNQHFVSSF